MIGLAVTWVAVAALLLGGGWLTGKALMRDVNFTHLSYESRLIADDITTQVEKRLDALERLAGLLDSRAGRDKATLRRELQHNGALLEWLDGLVVADEEGIIRADWPVVEGRSGLSTRDREFFRFVRAVKRPYVSEPFIGEASGEPMVLFVVPRLRGGDFHGYVGGFVNLHSGDFFQPLRRFRLGMDGYATITTASGTLLYHPDPDRILEPVPSRELHPVLHQALDGWEGQAMASRIEGGEAFHSYRQIWPADWIVAVSLPVEQMHASLQLLIERLWWAGVGFALLLLPLMWGLIRQTLRPLHRLETQIEEVGEGRRDRLSVDTRMEEIERLALTFNRVEDERSRALDSLRDREAFLDAVLSSSPLGMFVTDTDGRIGYMNPTLMELTGQAFATGSETDWIRHIHEDDRSSALDLWQHSLATGDDFLRQFRFLRADGRLLWLEVHASPVALDDQVIGFVGTVKDITDLQREEAMHRWEAEHDPLTGLLNRRGFERRLEEALTEWHQTGTSSVLMLFDLDRFKPINDEGGHALGDEMLVCIARTVEHEVRRSDYVARYGGDEFAVLLPGCTLDQARQIAEKLREAVAAIVVTQQERSYGVTLSLGVTAFKDQDDRIDSVIGRADEASYRAKSGGRNRVEVG